MPDEVFLKSKADFLFQKSVSEKGFLLVRAYMEGPSLGYAATLAKERQE